MVDDFHLIPEPVQKELIGAFRSSIEKGVALVLAAVPHRAGDAVRTQTNMKGRVETLSIGLWNPQELRQIPELGFGPRGLNCSIETEQVDRLVENAFRSPMLMQKLCLELTKENSVVERKDELQPIRPPANWDEFFSRIARGLGEDAEIRALAEGRPTKGQPREIFQLENGDSVDIYPLLLRAVARTGPEMELSLSQIRTEVETLLGATVASDRCSATLGRMSDIAAERAGEGEDPALEFTESRLHILDPYFAFSLAWGEPPVSSLTPVE